MKQRADMADNECRKIADKASKEKNECEKIENSIKTALEDMDIETENTVEEIAENIKNELTNAKEQLEIAEKRNTERIECELNLNAYTEKCKYLCKPFPFCTHSLLYVVEWSAETMSVLADDTIFYSQKSL